MLEYFFLISAITKLVRFRPSEQEMKLHHVFSGVSNANINDAHGIAFFKRFYIALQTLLKFFEIIPVSQNCYVNTCHFAPPSRELTTRAFQTNQTFTTWEKHGQKSWSREIPDYISLKCVAGAHQASPYNCRFPGTPSRGYRRHHTVCHGFQDESVRDATCRFTTRVVKLYIERQVFAHFSTLYWRPAER